MELSPTSQVEDLGVKQDDGIPALQLVWHTIAKSDGTQVSILGPKDLHDLLVVKPTTPPLDPVLPQSSQVGLYDSDSLSLGTSLLPPPPGLGRLNSLAQTANSTYCNLASDIRDAGTYSPARRSFEGYNPTAWDNIHQSPYRPGFGGYIPRAYRVQARDSQFLGWAGGDTYPDLSLTPIISPLSSVSHGPIGSPSPINPIAKPTKKYPEFENWCRMRLSDDKSSTNISTLPLSIASSTAASTVGEVQLDPDPIFSKTIRSSSPKSSYDTSSRNAKKASNGGINPDHESSSVDLQLPSEDCEKGNGVGNKAGYRKNSLKKKEADKQVDSPESSTAAVAPRALIIRGKSASENSVCTFPSHANNTFDMVLTNSGKNTQRSEVELVVSPTIISSSTPPSPKFKTTTTASSGKQSFPARPVTIPLRRTSTSGQVNATTPPITQQPTATTGLPPTNAPTFITADNVDPCRPRGVKKYCTYWFRTRKCDFYNQQGCAYSHDIHAYVAEYFPEKLQLYMTAYGITGGISSLTTQDMWDILDGKAERCSPGRDSAAAMGLDLKGGRSGLGWPLKRGTVLERPITVTITTMDSGKKGPSGAAASGAKKGKGKGGGAARAAAAAGKKATVPHSFTIKASAMKISTDTSAPTKKGKKGGKKDTTTKTTGAGADDDDDDHDGDISAATAAAAAKAKEGIDEAGFLNLNTPATSIKGTTARQPIPLNSQPWKTMKKQVAAAAAATAPGTKAPGPPGTAKKGGGGPGKAAAAATTAATSNAGKQQNQVDVLLPGIESQTGMTVEVGGGDKKSDVEVDLIDC